MISLDVVSLLWASIFFAYIFLLCHGVERCNQLLIASQKYLYRSFVCVDISSLPHAKLKSSKRAKERETLKTDWAKTSSNDRRRKEDESEELLYKATIQLLRCLSFLRLAERLACVP